MKLVVTGASGFIGLHLCQYLAQNGHSVRAVVRKNCPQLEQIEAVDVVHFDLSSPASDGWQKVLLGCDALVHLVAKTHSSLAATGEQIAEYEALNVTLTGKLAQQCIESGVGKFIYLSSIKVNGERSKVDDSGQVIAMGPNDTPDPEDIYGRTKLAAEQQLQKICQGSSLTTIVLRPPLVYGPGMKGNLLRLFRLVDSGIPIPLGAVDNHRSMISTENLSAAIESAIRGENRGFHVFTLSDVTISTAELVRAIARGLNRTVRLLPCPKTLLSIFAKLTGRHETINRLTGSLVVDAQAFRAEYDWQADYPFEQAMADTARWYQTQNKTTK